MPNFRNDHPPEIEEDVKADAVENADQEQPVHELPPEAQNMLQEFISTVRTLVLQVPPSHWRALGEGFEQLRKAASSGVIHLNLKGQAGIDPRKVDPAIIEIARDTAFLFEKFDIDLLALNNRIPNVEQSRIVKP